MTDLVYYFPQKTFFFKQKEINWSCGTVISFHWEHFLHYQPKKDFHVILDDKGRLQHPGEMTLNLNSVFFKTSEYSHKYLAFKMSGTISVSVKVNME